MELEQTAQYGCLLFRLKKEWIDFRPVSVPIGPVLHLPGQLNGPGDRHFAGSRRAPDLVKPKFEPAIYFDRLFSAVFFTDRDENIRARLLPCPASEPRRTA